MRPLLTAAALLALAGCVPYTVGTTADVAPQDEVQVTTSIAVVPGGFEYDAFSEGESDEETYSSSYILATLGARFSIGPNTDVGVHAPAFSGIVVTAKHRFQQAQPGAPLGLAAMGGAGFINGGEHAHFEATLIASGREDLMATPYGGLRLMQTLPLSEGAAHDLPTVGPFGGIRLGSPDLGVSLEVGVFYDDSALDIRERDFVVVPSVSLHGARLLEVLRGF
jgi:hypothetical protein